MKKIYFTIATIVLMLFMSLTISGIDIFVEDASSNTYYPTEEYIFYLPSHIKPENVKIATFSGVSFTYYDKNGNSFEAKNTITLDLTPYIKDYGSTSVYSLKTEINNLPHTLTFYFASTLPSIYVETSLGSKAIIEDAQKDSEAKVNIKTSDSVYEYCDTTSTYSQFKIRGNTTRDYAKKPFQLKLSRKADLFGLGEGKTWILLANYLDQSLLRNSIMYQIAGYLGMAHSSFQSVDLYIDGEYYGIYLLCEKVQISSTRVNIFELEKENNLLNAEYGRIQHASQGALIDETIITEYTYIEGITNPTDITGGYLLELDNNYYRQELCYFATSNGNHYVLKSPEYASKEQVEYIARLFAEMEEAIMSLDGYNRLGKHYTEYIDIDSFVYAYRAAELSRNYDCGSSSMYFYKDRDINGATSKIFKGPLWDCDNTLGNIHKNDASNPLTFWAKDRSIWKGLSSKAEFNQRVTEEFTRVYDQIFDMIDKNGFIYQQLDIMGTSIHMERSRWRSNNYTYWPLYYDGIHYDRWQSAPVFNFISNYSDGIDRDETTVIGYLCEHIEKRVNLLATEWDCDVTLRTRTLNEEIVSPPKNDTESEPNDPITPTPSDLKIEKIIIIVSSVSFVLMATTGTILIALYKKGKFAKKQ